MNRGEEQTVHIYEWRTAVYHENFCLKSYWSRRHENDAPTCLFLPHKLLFGTYSSRIEPCFAFVLQQNLPTVFCILGIQSMPSCRVCLSQKQGKRAKILFASFRQSVGTIVSNPTPELCLFCSTYSRQHDFAWHGISMEQI
jgi:hypothetical protein